MRFKNFSDQMGQFYKDGRICNVTFQTTDSCNCACTYCYQTNKCNNFMTIETGRKGVDLLFKLYEEDNPLYPINKTTTGIVLEFIGGEPLLNVPVMDDICSYFFEKCIELNHPWTYRTRIGFISNGTLYFNEEVQNFLKKFDHLLSFSITIDGPQEIHDLCRVYPNGQGTFSDVYRAVKHYSEHYHPMDNTKVTLAPENIHELSTIAKFFIDNNIETIMANCAYEPEWTVEHAKIFYQQLKELTPILLEHPRTYLWLFDETIGTPMTDSADDDRNWCGGTGRMLSFDPKGDLYPCIRYMASSLNGAQEPIKLGDINGFFTDEKTIKIQEDMNAVTRTSQSPEKCLKCKIARGCAWCSAWNYQLYGTVNKRCTNICIMHKARVLANVYFWNQYYKKYNIDRQFLMYLPKEEALEIIDENEYNMLLDLGGEGEE